MRPEKEGAGWRAEYLPDERKLLVPLALGGELLGIFQARGVRMRAPKSMLPLLSRMGSVCVEKLLLYKRSIRCARPDCWRGSPLFPCWNARWKESAPV